MYMFYFFPQKDQHHEVAKTYFVFYSDSLKIDLAKCEKLKIN